MFKNYFTVAWRNLRRNKAYAIINTVGLSLGIACAILIFTIVRYHLTFDSFHANRERIYRIITEFHDETVTHTQGVPGPLGKALRTDFSLMDKTARIVSYWDALLAVSGKTGTKKFREEAGIAFTEPSFFDIFNFPLLQGDRKTILAAPNEAVITEAVAIRYFGSVANAMGRVIRFDNKINFTVTGILKDLPANTDTRQQVFVSYSNLKEQNSYTASDDSWGGVYSETRCYVLLKPSVTSAQLDKALGLTIQKYYNDKDKQVWRFRAFPLATVHFDANFASAIDKRYLWGLALIGLFLIVTACVNFVNLATAQALSRSKEVGVRKVLGGLRTQLFWQFIAETALITLMAAVAACVIAWIAMPYLSQLLDVNLQLPLFNSSGLPLFLLLLVIVVTFLSGAYPGLVMARFQAVLSLKGGLSQRHIGGFSLRRILVITQFAICQMLVIGAIVIASQLYYSRTTDLGFNKDAVVMVPIPSQDKAKISTLRKQLAAIPGVENASFCFRAPASGNVNATGVRYDSRRENEHWSTNMKDADDQYLSTFGLTLVAGRNFFPSDTTREFVVNETFVRKLNITSPQEVIGKMLYMDGGEKKGPIVGVVKDFYTRSFHSEIDPLCMAPAWYQYISCGVKINTHNLKSSMTAIEHTWNETFPEYLFTYEFLDDSIAKFYKQDMLILRLVEILTGIAIFIGCLGLYGLVSFMAVQKTREIGVRKVLGANVSHILWLFGKEFSQLLLIAFVIAAPIAWYVMYRYLQDFKYHIQIDGKIFAASILCSFIVAALTVSYHAVRAALSNPIKNLRTE
ncbi:MAG TPA: ABC transporter permease [Chitinophaga sp.]|uniref:ABC transporter permease n=1 Tax=Chitinophaga sp. TaxID=1869181 RepID=UPI002BE346DC|nr:ABC transporter permease [Chitinophaga sp.]HVI46029.1 ABC transporter permease [Chitinophaga sp.]